MSHASEEETELHKLLTRQDSASSDATRGFHRVDSFLEQHLGSERFDDLNSDGLSTVSTFFIAVNMILGAGILGLPYAFYQSGAWLATIALAFSTLLAGITAGYLIECTGWCEGLAAASQEDKLDALVGQLDASAQQHRLEDDEYNPRRFMIRQKKFEMSEMCGMLLASKDGKQHYRKFFEFVLATYTFGSCWLYASVFASTLSMLIRLPGQEGADISQCWDTCDHHHAWKCVNGCVWLNASNTCTKDSTLEPPCWTSYHFFLLVFFGVQVLLSCSQLSTFKNIQVFCSAWVFAAVLIMVSTSLFAVVVDTPADQAYDQIPPFNPSKIVNIISSGLFAQMCHYGVPSVVRMTKRKTQAKTVFRCALAYTLALYILLGFSTSFHLGPQANPIITLNWDKFNGGAKPGAPVPLWASAARWVVLLFPVFTVSGGFSLSVLPLSETLISSLLQAPPHLDSGLPAPAPPRLSLSALRSTSSRTKSLLTRVLLSLFPILCAACLRDVVRILEFNTFFAFVVAFFTPCLLQFRAFAAAAARFGEAGARNPYWDAFSAPRSVLVLLALSCILFVVVGYQTVMDYIS